VSVTVISEGMALIGASHDGERWMPIHGHEEYLISSDGRVWSAARNGKPGRIRILLPNRHGYLTVTLSLGSRKKQQRVRVHNLVAETFIGPRPERAHIRHLNGDSFDNRLENLAYGTAAENAADTIRHGHHVNASKTECKYDHPLAGDNVIRSPGRRICRTCRREHDKRRAIQRAA